MLLVDKQEALYRTMHNTFPSYQEKNWGILTLKHWFGFLPDRPASILEVGCGNGKLCRLLTDMHYDTTGVDLVTGSYNRDGYNFVQHDLMKDSMPFESKEFDMAVSFDVLEHLPESCIDGVLQDIFRVARKVAIVVPCLHDTTRNKLLAALHLTVKSPEWWLARLNKYSGNSTKRAVVFTDPENNLNRMFFYSGEEEE